MLVPLFDLKRILKDSRDELSTAFNSCLDHGKFIMGPEVSYFEADFSKKVGAKHCIGVSSGTDALQAIFMALDIEPGGEVLVPSFTFVASASSIIRAGLKPVFVDIEIGSFHPSLRTIENAWTENTKAVLFVHLFGEPEDLGGIKNLCDQRSAFLIEDCAQSYGSTAGNTGLASAYSFFPAKNLGCLGDGGAATTSDDSFAKVLRTIRSHGSNVKYSYEKLGGNFRLDTLQAGFLSALMPHSDEWISKRRRNATFYTESLENIEELILPLDRKGHAWNQYTLRTSRRDELKEFLDNNGIGSAIYYPIPLHKSEGIFGAANSASLLETEKRCKEVISIPIYPGLRDDERRFVADKIKEFFNDT